MSTDTVVTHDLLRISR